MHCLPSWQSPPYWCSLLHRRCWGLPPGVLWLRGCRLLGRESGIPTWLVSSHASTPRWCTWARVTPGRRLLLSGTGATPGTCRLLLSGGLSAPCAGLLLLSRRLSAPCAGLLLLSRRLRAPGTGLLLLSRRLRTPGARLLLRCTPGTGLLLLSPCTIGRPPHTGLIPSTWHRLLLPLRLPS